MTDATRRLYKFLVEMKRITKEEYKQYTVEEYVE